MNLKIVASLLSPTLGEFVVGSLADAAAKSSVLLCLAIVVSMTMRRASAATRHLVWLSTLGAALALPAISLCLPHWRVLPIWMDLTSRTQMADTIMMEMATISASNGQLETTPLPQVHDASDPILEPRSRSASIPSVSRSRPRNSLVATALLAVWGLGTVTFLLRIARSAWTLHRFESSLRAITSGPVATATQEVASELGVRSPLLYFGTIGTMPMVWGIRRGRILLPAEATKWDAVQLRAVLLHELAHLRRYDPLTLVIAQLARALHWFNPLVWLAMNRLQVEQERACDDYVLRGGVNPSDYAGHLLDLVTRLEPVPTAASVALAMTDRPRIEGRLRIILDATCNRRRPSHWLAGMTMLLAASATISLAMLRAADETRPQPIRVPQVTSQHGTRNSPLRICLIASADGSLASEGIVVEDLPIKGMDGLKKELEKIAAGRKDVLAIIIEADESLRYQHLEQVVNIALRAGFKKIELRPHGERIAESAGKPHQKNMVPAKTTDAGKAKDEKATAGRSPLADPKERLEKDRERLMVLRELAEVQRSLLRGGKTTLDLVLAAEKDLLAVELEFAETPAQRIEIFERAVKTLVELDERTKEKVEGGVESKASSLMTTAARLKAQSDLIRERAQEQP